MPDSGSFDTLIEHGKVAANALDHGCLNKLHVLFVDLDHLTFFTCWAYHEIHPGSWGQYFPLD